MKIAIYGRVNERNLPPALQGLFDKLETNNSELLITADYLAYLQVQFKIGKKVKVLDDFNSIRGQADFLLSVGGDGTLLETIAFVRNSGIPILGINTGRLGFLAGVTVAEAVAHAIENLKDRKFSIEKDRYLNWKLKIIFLVKLISR